MTEITEELLQRYLKGDASDAELEAVVRWIGESDANAGELFQLERIADMAVDSAADSAAATRQALGRLQLRIAAAQRASRRRHRSWWMGVAASLLIVIGLGAVLMAGGIGRGEMIHVAATTEAVNVTLPDGSHVWLNTNSAIDYPEKFASNREVKLSGEAYFEVAHDGEHPFTVDGEYLDVTVLGTRFTFHNGTPSSDSFVSLVEGSVKVKDACGENSVVLTPGQKAVYEPGAHRLTVVETDPVLDAVWHDHNLPFNGATIRDIAKALSRVYNIEVTVADNVDRTATYSGVALSCPTIDSTLSTLSHTLPIRYKVSEGKVLITRR